MGNVYQYRYGVPKDADPSFTLPGASTMERVGAVKLQQYSVTT